MQKVIKEANQSTHLQTRLMSLFIVQWILLANAQDNLV